MTNLAGVQDLQSSGPSTRGVRIHKSRPRSDSEQRAKSHRFRYHISRSKQALVVFEGKDMTIPETPPLYPFLSRLLYLSAYRWH